MSYKPYVNYLIRNRETFMLMEEVPLILSVMYDMNECIAIRLEVANNDTERIEKRTNSLTKADGTGQAGQAFV